jgi:hypothetical protein
LLNSSHALSTPPGGGLKRSPPACHPHKEEIMNRSTQDRSELRHTSVATRLASRPAHASARRWASLRRLSLRTLANVAWAA